MNIRELKDNSGVVFSPKVSADSVYLSGSTTNLTSKLNSVDSSISGKMDKVTLSTVATSGSYTDLSNKPSLAKVATSGNYNDLSGRPSLASVATSGNYYDLSNRPTIPNVKNELNTGNLNDITTSGFYRINNGQANSPGDWGQLIVCHGEADTITQIYGDYNSGALHTRSGAAINNPSGWHGWYQLIMSNFVNPNITATGFYVSSLRSLKENIEPTKVKAVDLINSQEIVDFNYKADEDKAQKVGLIADDSDPLFLDKKGETVDLYNTCGILMKAVQELSKRVEELEQKLN